MCVVHVCVVVVCVVRVSPNFMLSSAMLYGICGKRQQQGIKVLKNFVRIHRMLVAVSANAMAPTMLGMYSSRENFALFKMGDSLFVYSTQSK